MLGGCDGGHRFPVCRSDSDCAANEAAPICFDLRCVRCRYDTDCQDGQICSPASECVGLSSKPRSTDEAGAPGWDPSNWQECAAACKEEACLERCSERFKQ